MKGHSTVLPDRPGARPTPSFQRRPATLGWLNVVIGAWVFVTPFIGAGRAFILWSNGIAGAISTLVACLIYPYSPWHAWGAGITGIWLLFSSLFHGAAAGLPGIWNNLLLGSFISLSGLVGAVRAQARKQ